MNIMDRMLHSVRDKEKIKEEIAERSPVERPGYGAHMDIRRVCKNCMDYNLGKEQCLVRYTILKDKTRTPMKRKPNQTGCQVFMFAP